MIELSLFVIEPSALSVPLRQLKALFAPDPLKLLVVHLPAFDMQQLGNLAIAVAPILLRQPDQRQPQSIVIFGLGLLIAGEILMVGMTWFGANIGQVLSK